DSRHRGTSGICLRASILASAGFVLQPQSQTGQSGLSPRRSVEARVPDVLIPPSSEFERLAEGSQFRDRIAVIVKAPPDAIFRALRTVALRDMRLAWALGEIRYLPARLGGHMPAADSSAPFLSKVVESGTLVLRDDSP